MDAPLLPWQVHPALSRKRLETLAGLIRDVHADAVATHDWDKGDNRWSFGCRVYVRVKRAIVRASKEGTGYAWLRVGRNRGLGFLFAIDDVPLRVFSGAAQEPPARATRVSADEGMALQLSLLPHDDPSLGTTRFWRLFVQRGETLRVSAITLAQMDDAGTNYLAYPIALDAAPVLDVGAPAAVAHVDARPAAIDLTPPPVTARRVPDQHGRTAQP